ncbi:hypothetical protein GOP47_0020906 [Adiantum capillus-veneris]|uniref:Hydroxymethylglutaryl-CoA synthase n=1 Tax=Adiantum capillus-veneris TaxID=13818 RepID=A0A9D4UA24_ADICA|nr:hypothetical protein GOP47_0020906 [Adiantum capillus-veneris]
MAERPQNVGIVALDVYFPATSVLQDALEDFDGASKGKYTIGLGQDRLAFCSDLEDVISMSLTVVQSLLHKYNVKPSQIGRLEVGSETVVDKSKSIKTWIMQLFEKSGNTDIEGVDSTNACYGGTAALLNCMNWVESTAWDGRFGLVVAADSAVYAEGAARPTGGAGAVAMLIGPNAPLVMERKYTGTHMTHVYDFYKPKLASEYPVVDGKLSQTCYLKALDICYGRLCEKFEKAEGKPFSLSEADFVVCHSPYNKLVQKSFGRLVYNDFLRQASYLEATALAALEPFRNVGMEESYSNRDLEKISQQVGKPLYATKVEPATLIPKQVGNMYCASLYGGLVSLLHQKAGALEGKRTLMFSYGSGLASTLFSIRFREGEGHFTMSRISSALDVANKIQSFITVSPEEFEKTMKIMETRYGANDFKPVAKMSNIRPGTFFLIGVDALYRRSYDVKQAEAAANGVLH